MNHYLPSKYRGVIYDCDGVLFDSTENNKVFYNRVCRAMGRAPLRDDEFKYVHMHTVQEAVSFLFREKPEWVEKARSFVATMDPNDFIPLMKMEPHLLQALDLLQKRGVRRAVDTNRTHSMRLIMDAFGLWPYFEMVVTALDVQNPKPHAESVIKILQAFGLEKEEAIFVGDSEVDRQTADAAGIRFIAYKNPQIANGWLIQDHLELLNLLS